MALSVEAKLIVSKNGTEIGMRKDGDNNFGTFIPNYLGDSMTLVVAAYSDGSDFIMITNGKVDNLDTIPLTSASGASITLTWDAATSAYKGAVGALGTILDSHYDGSLDLLIGGAVAPTGTGTGTGTGTSDPATSAPTGFAKPTATLVTATGGQVNWTAPTGGDPITGYSVAVDDGGTPITGSPFAMAGSTLKKVLTGLTATTSYNVVVTATNGGGSIAATALTLTTTA